MRIQVSAFGTLKRMADHPNIQINSGFRAGKRVEKHCAHQLEAAIPGTKIPQSTDR
jgi:hypothetical protein